MGLRRRNAPSSDARARGRERYGDPSTEEYWRQVGAEIRRRGDPFLDVFPPTLEPWSWTVTEDDNMRMWVGHYLRGAQHRLVGTAVWASEMARAVRTGVLGDRWNEAVHTYVSPRHQALDQHQKYIRDIAYELKRRDDSADVLVHRSIAADAMFHLLPPSCVLVPAPGSGSGTDSAMANRLLANELAWRDGNRSLVVSAVIRAIPVMPSHQRRQQGLEGASVDEHLATMQLVREVPVNRPVVIVDNVIASGATVEAVRRLIGRPDARGVAWAQPLRQEGRAMNPPESGAAKARGRPAQRKRRKR